MDSGKPVEREVPKSARSSGRSLPEIHYRRLFHNEPSEQQSREIELLHHDFEQSNALFFGKDRSTPASWPIRSQFCTAKMKNPDGELEAHLLNAGTHGTPISTNVINLPAGSNDPRLARRASAGSGVIEHYA
jgi:hypothetical protein